MLCQILNLMFNKYWIYIQRVIQTSNLGVISGFSGECFELPIVSRPKQAFALKIDQVSLFYSKVFVLMFMYRFMH